MTKPNSEDIYSVLEREIVSLQIMPFEDLSENALCDRFNVSRTIVRSALQRLAMTGFVEITPYVGTKVTGIDLDAVNEFIYLRTVTETAVLTDCLKTITPLQKEELRFRKNAFEEKVREIGDLSSMNARMTNEVLSYDLEFHHCYFRYQRKELLWSFLTQPRPNYSRFIRLDMMGGKNIPDVLEEHNKLMDIIDHNKINEIQPLLSRHLNGGTRRLGTKLFTEEYRQYIQTSDLKRQFI